MICSAVGMRQDERVQRRPLEIRFPVRSNSAMRLLFREGYTTAVVPVSEARELRFARILGGLTLIRDVYILSYCASTPGGARIQVVPLDSREATPSTPVRRKA